MILIDEGWKALDDEVFAARIRDWLKTLRKRNALVGFATQSARDALESRISTALVEQTATMVFMPNSRARPEDYCDGFGLTEHELALIRSANHPRSWSPLVSPSFLVRRSSTRRGARAPARSVGCEAIANPSRPLVTRAAHPVGQEQDGEADRRDQGEMPRADQLERTHSLPSLRSRMR